MSRTRWVVWNRPIPTSSAIRRRVCQRYLASSESLELTAPVQLGTAPVEVGRAVRQRIDRDHGLHQRQPSGKIPGGARRGGHRAARRKGDIRLGHPRVADPEPAMRPDVPGYEHLGRRVPGCTVGAEQPRRRVPGEHAAPIADQQVRGKRPNGQIRFERDRGEHVGEQPDEPGPVELAAADQAECPRLATPERGVQTSLEQHAAQRDRRGPSPWAFRRVQPGSGRTHDRSCNRLS
jgi:hypothetical protein